ncbi:MAG: energy-coupling factor transporter transmembrane component T [Candidatus Acetothermia bacterium]
MNLYHARRLHPYTKLFFSLVVGVLALVLSRIVSLACLLALLFLTLVAGCRSQFKGLLVQLAPFRYLIPILFLLNSIFYASGQGLWSVPLLPLQFTEGGLVRATIISLRLVGVAAVSLWFARATEAEELELALAELGLSWKLAFVFSLTLRLVPEFKSRFKQIKRSQVSRGLKIEGPPWKRIKAQLPMITPFLAALIRYGYQLGESLKARGFDSGKNKTFYLELKAGKRDLFFSLYAAGALTCFILFLYP